MLLIILHQVYVIPLQQAQPKGVTPFWLNFVLENYLIDATPNGTENFLHQI